MLLQNMAVESSSMLRIATLLPPQPLKKILFQETELAEQEAEC
jgi:hypothetical protein